MNQLPFIERAIGHGRRTAICGGGASYTYQDICRQSELIAAAVLNGEDDLKESRVAFQMRPGAEYIAALWGIWRAGGIAVPLSLSATQEELVSTLSDSQSEVVVAEYGRESDVAAITQRQKIRLVTEEDIRNAGCVELPQVAPDRRAMMLYTSGTTSRPKGVVTTHLNIQAQIQSLIDAWHWNSEDRIPLFLPLHHIHGIINIVCCALWSGAKIEPFQRFDTETILRRVAEDAWSVFMAVPTIYVKLVSALESMSDADRTVITDGFRRMRLMVSGSAALPASVHTRWADLTGQKLLERYGMTEIGMALSNPYHGERRPGAVGQPLPGVGIRLQSETGELISDEDVSGEIQVRGANVFQEYWNRPDVTGESFTDGWFRTGDIAVLERGYYRIMGRNSVDIIKSGGYKLSALEIEASLLDHSSIAECAVVGIPDQTWGEVVAAAVVLRPGRNIEMTELRNWCKVRVSAYKVPRMLLIVKELPRNSLGKVKKPAVRILFES
ncbi:MAG: acyl-CoA synthetase [Fuerstiella sp.]|nr:acyl-CoA synthetase [Fuerstiella sp.]